MTRSGAYRGTLAMVLGASGFIGRWVARALVDGGARVCAVVRDRELAERVLGRFGFESEIEVLDLGHFADVSRLIARVRPEIIFNLAGYGVDPAEVDSEAACRINAGLLEVLCEALAAFPSRDWPGQVLVHAGSAAEYGTIGGDLSEISTPRPTSLYGKSKLSGTLLMARCAERLGLGAIVARLFTVYGPGENPHRLLPSLLEAARTGEPLALTAGRQQRDFTYVADVAEGLLRLGLAKSGSGEVINLATGRLTSVREFTEVAARILGIGRDRLRTGALPTRPDEMSHDRVTTARLRELVSWFPPNGIEEGIRRTVEFGQGW